MKAKNIFNEDRVNSLNVSPNSYIDNKKINGNKVRAENISQVIFPEPYENVQRHYNKNQFYKPQQEDCEHKSQQNLNNNKSMFDIKSLLPMLMSGNFNDMLKPFMSLLAGGGSSANGINNVSKIFELFKPKAKPTKKVEKEDDVSSKFDDMIIIED